MSSNVEITDWKFSIEVELTDSFVVENFWISSVRVSASKLPDIEEALPVDEGEEVGQGKVPENLFSQKRRSLRLECIPVQLQGLLTGYLERQVDLKNNLDFL